MKKDQKQDIDKIAGRMINHLKDHDHRQREGEETLWQAISAEIDEKESKHKTLVTPSKSTFRYWVAASVAVAASALFFIYIGNHLRVESCSELDNYISRLPDDALNNTQVQLLFSDREKVNVEKDSIGIVYDSDGTVQIDQTQRRKAESTKQQVEEEFNQVIVPKGKSAFVTLSDGTKMHVNSGTRVVYPRVFTGERREIYVEGEVFLDVTRNEEKPFLVKTSKFNVSVLGTTFNVNAYKEDERGEVVLVSGLVKLTDNQNHHTMLQPSQLVAVNDGRASPPRRVDTDNYTAWVNGTLIAQSETLETIFKKIHRFYAIPIVVSPQVQHEVLDGKIDLRQSLPELIRLISVAVPIEFEEINGVYYINQKRK